MTLREKYFGACIKNYLYKKLTKHPDYILYKAVLIHQKYRKYKDSKNTIMMLLYSFRANKISSKYNLELYGKYGKNLRIWHGNVILNGNAILGDNVVLHGNNCIGEKKGKSPIIGNNVNIGYGATIIGNIKIGNNVIIGANAVVTKSFEDNSIVVGNPARKIN